MKMVNILACAGMVTGFFLILRLTPMEFTDGVFRHFLKSPDSIKAEIQKTQKRKKPSILQREVEPVSYTHIHTHETKATIG